MRSGFVVYPCETVNNKKEGNTQNGLRRTEIDENEMPSRNANRSKKEGCFLAKCLTFCRAPSVSVSTDSFALRYL